MIKNLERYDTAGYKTIARNVAKLLQKEANTRIDSFNILEPGAGLKTDPNSILGRGDEFIDGSYINDIDHMNNLNISRNSSKITIEDNKNTIIKRKYDLDVQNGVIDMKVENLHQWTFLDLYLHGWDYLQILKSKNKVLSGIMHVVHGRDALLTAYIVKKEDAQKMVSDFIETYLSK